MKNIIKSIVILPLLAVVVLCTQSCEGYLDTVPTNAVSSSTVWSSASTAGTAVLGVYNALYDHWGKNYSYDTRGIPYDCFSSVMDIGTPYKARMFVTNGSCTPSNSYVLQQFEMWYTLVYRANDAITNLPNVPDLDEDLRDQYIAECKFLRAYAYSLMNIFWGGVPLYLENVDNSEATLARSSTEEVWDQVIADLTDCINEPNLPDKYDSGDSDYGRITKGAAYAFRGQAYQFLEDWSSALADFEAVEDCGYELYSPSGGAEGNDDFAELFTEDNEECDEIIFSVQCEEKLYYGNTKDKGYGPRSVSTSGWNCYMPSPAYVEMFECADGSEFDWDDYCDGWSDMSNSERIVFFCRDGLESGDGDFGSYDCTSYYNSVVSAGADMDKYLDQGNEERIMKAYEDRDPRLMQTVITPYSQYYGYTSTTGECWFTMRWPYIAETVEPHDLRSDTNAYLYYLCRKYLPYGQSHSTAWASPIDVYVCRYAEVLIRRAECLNELGRTDEAVTYINMVRKRAGHVLLNDSDYPATIVDGQDDMRERIRKEYYYEIGCEESMYQNELRWGTWYERKFYSHNSGVDGELNSNGLMQMWGTTTHTYTSTGEHLVLWPIPASERQMNENLTQNPGYSD